MKRVVFILVLMSLLATSFAQEEIWGYQSFGGEIGGGLVYKLDLENNEAQTVYRFGYTDGYRGYIRSDNPLVDGGNGLLYSTVQLTNLKSTKSILKLFSYDPQTGELDTLSRLPNSAKIIYTDKENHILYFWNDDSGGYITKYDLQYQEFSFVASLDESFGLQISGEWTKINGNYYYLNQYGGLYDQGTLVEFNPETLEFRKLIDFDGIKNPQGSLIQHQNGFIYGVFKRGGSTNHGGIFKVDIDEGEYEILIEFSDETGRPPSGDIILANDGFIYGMTRVLGDYGKGSIFKYDPNNNELEAVYHFNPDSSFMDNHLRSYKWSYNNDKHIYFSTAPYDGTANEDKGYLMRFDIETLEMTEVLNYSETTARYPVSQITFFNDSLFCLANNSSNNALGGVFSINEEFHSISFQNIFYHIDSPEDGYNPIWLCQGVDEYVYGMTKYGGEENKGLMFSLNYETGEFEKIFDFNNFPFEFNPREEAFLLDNGNIFGFLNAYENGEYLGLKAFEFNPFTQMIDTVLSLPSSGRIYKFRMNKSGMIYSSSGRPLEIDPYLRKIDTLYLPTNSGINNICESKNESNVYFGSMNDSLFRWDRNDNSIECFGGISNNKSEKGSIYRNDLYVSKEDIIYTDFLGSEEKPSWVGSIAYDYVNDSTLKIPRLSKYSYDNSYFAYIETQISDELISIHFAKSYNRIIDLKNNQDRYFSAEESPFYVDYFYEWGGLEIDGGNFHFIMSPRVGLISTEPKEFKYYWLGFEDSIWVNKNNWHRGKFPETDAEIVISRYANHFPYLDTLVEVPSLLIEKDAQVNVSPNGALSCEILNNYGIINLKGNSNQRASLIFEELENKGMIDYQYKSDFAIEKLLAMPVSELSCSGMDSMELWQFRNHQWTAITDTAAQLDCHQVYKFGVDSLHPMHFFGELHAANEEFRFRESGLQAIPNPYTASFSWEDLDLSHLSHKALYHFHEEDSSFYSYVDALGDFPPLIQPLDVFWVEAEAQESLNLEMEKLMHAQDFETTEKDNQLVVKASGTELSDRAYISFNPQATAQFDKEFDARKWFISTRNRPNIFTWADTNKLSINQLPDTTMLDMAVLAGEEGNYTISIEDNQNFDFVVLEDLILHTQTDLLKENYSFKYFLSDGNYPFKLYFKKWVLEPLEEGDIEIYYYPESIVVRSKKQIELAEITFFDLAGRVAEQYRVENFFHFEKPVNLPAGHYIVQLRSSDLVINKKVLVR